ncbi:MAG: hypothetical protein KDA21_00545 [Phycisphaerales bacterium]|nr:hypothetical protein [Phycisphaerales bacterium]
MSKMRNVSVVSLIAWGAGLAMVAPVLGGPIWEECRMEDAGKDPPSAQIPNQLPPGTALEEICGKFDPLEPADQQDMFLIQICDPAAFSASATVTSGSMNLQLYLFDINGRGLLFNDDAVGFNPAFGNVPTDGSIPPLSVPGYYYIAVTLFNSVAQDTAAAPLFAASTPTEVSGPDGPGGANPFATWGGSVTSGQSGEYSLRMTGTCYAPAPGAAVAMLLGASPFMRRRRN